MTLSQQTAQNREKFQSMILSSSMKSTIEMMDTLTEETWKAAQEEVVERHKKMDEAAEWLWGVVANVSGSDWKLQSEEWQKAATGARHAYFAAFKELTSERTMP